MDYEKIYAQLIEHRKQNKIVDKSISIERHHIKPKKIYPELAKDKDNIVTLTYKEHFLAHHLLFKIYLNKFGKHDKRTIKMAYAFKRMCFDKKHNCKINIRQYAIIKQITSQDTSETVKKYWKSLSDEQYKEFINSHILRGKANGMYGKGHLISGENNGAYNKKWIFNPLTKEQKYISKDIIDQYLENGWKLGLLRKSKGTTGTKWINNGNIRKSVQMSELKSYLDNGWKLGFRIKQLNEY